MSLSVEKETAFNAVKKACRLCKTVQGNLVSEETIQKKDRSPVTVADYGAQAIIIHELKKAFPEDPIVAEEDFSQIKTQAGELLKQKVRKHLEPILPELSEDEIVSTINRGDYEGGSEGRFWTLDPIDGTKGFLRNDQYAVALSLIEDGEIILGILGCPNLPTKFDRIRHEPGAIFSAVKGEGTLLHIIDSGVDLKISVSEEENPSLASFCESVESSHSSHDDSQKIAEILGITKEPVRIDSQCKYGVLARGEATIYLRLPTKKDYKEKIWDHAAGYIVVKQAGGEVTDCYGKPLDFSRGKTLKANTGIVGTNGRIHEEVLSAVKQVISG